MADLKISQLTSATTPLAGTEVLPIVQSGSTVKVSVANLTAGRAVASAGGTFSDNFVQGTAAKGFNFTANTPAAGMTSQLLNWYEEGTWTPTVSAFTGTYTTVTGQVGSYTRIGRQITVKFQFMVTNKGTGTTGYTITNLPFVASGFPFAGAGYNLNSGEMTTIYMAAANEINGFRYDTADPVVLNNTMVGQITYFI
jgi:hypothetical protein